MLDLKDGAKFGNAVLAPSFLGNLDASFINTGTLSSERLPSTLGNASTVYQGNGALLTGLSVNSSNASALTEGTLSANIFPSSIGNTETTYYGNGYPLTNLNIQELTGQLEAEVVLLSGGTFGGDGAATSTNPCFTFENNATTGLYPAGPGILGITSNGIAIAQLSAANGLVVNANIEGTYILGNGSLLNGIVLNNASLLTEGTLSQALFPVTLGNSTTVYVGNAFGLSSLNLANTTGTLAVTQGGTGVTNSTGSENVVLSNGATLTNVVSISGNAFGLSSLNLANTTGILGVAQGGTGVTSSTGNGNVVLSNGATLTNVVAISGNAFGLSSLNLANATGTLAVTQGGTGVTTSTGNENVVLSNGATLTNVVSISGNAFGLSSLNLANTTGTLAVTQGGTGVTTSTGNGNVVLSNGATLTNVVSISGNAFGLGNLTASNITSGTLNNARLPATIGNASTQFVGNGSQLTGLSTPLSISNVKIANDAWTVLDDLAVSTDGGYCLVNGSGFAPGSIVSVGTDFALSTSYVSTSQLKAVVPAKSSGSYNVTVIRGDTTVASLPLAITYSASPVWSTSVDLGNVIRYETFTRTLASTSDSNVTYTNTTALPPQTTFSSNGTLTGNITNVLTDNTVYTFQIKATDLELQDISRTFSLQYYLDFVARKLTASDTAANDQFGFSVSMSSDGSRLVVGAQQNDAGAVYIFVRSQTTWTQEAKLTASDGAASDNFGNSVSMNSDGSRVVVGAYASDPGGTSNAGAAYVFSRSGTTWTQEFKLIASDKAASDQFGYSVSMNTDGSRVVVGAYLSDPGGIVDAGAAYVFSRSGTTWTQEAKLIASDKLTVDCFGFSVSMNSDGSRVVVGANLSDPGAISNAGAAYVYSRSGTTWTQEFKLTASDKVASDQFGVSVSMNSDGSRVVVGASSADPGGTVDAGAAYIFIRSGTTWTQEAKLIASDKAQSDLFGTSVFMNSDGSRVVVGAITANPGGTLDAGAAYIFIRSGTTWTQEAKLIASDKAQSEWFGSSVSMNSGGSRVVVGARLDNSAAGAAYVCGLSNGTWLAY